MRPLTEIITVSVIMVAAVLLALCITEKGHEYLHARMDQKNQVGDGIEIENVLAAPPGHLIIGTNVYPVKGGGSSTYTNINIIAN